VAGLDQHHDAAWDVRCHARVLLRQAAPQPQRSERGADSLIIHLEMMDLATYLAITGTAPSDDRRGRLAV
jgi:hypothetical protein